MWESGQALPITHVERRTGIPNARLHQIINQLMEDGMVENANLEEYTLDRRPPERLYKLTSKGMSEYPKLERYYTELSGEALRVPERRSLIQTRD
jgi:predicted transcriptional regulator